MDVDGYTKLWIIAIVTIAYYWVDSVLRITGPTYLGMICGFIGIVIILALLSPYLRR